MSQADRRPIIGGNWKMNTTLQEAQDLARALSDRIGQTPGCEVVVCPPFTNLQTVGKILGSGPILLGAQDVFWADRGAYTGEISPPMVRSVGVEYVIVGHSERRHIIGESNEIVSKKARAAIDGGLRVILAVGETADERSQGQMEGVLEHQLTHSVARLTRGDVPSLVIAYEPVWAIGTGVTATAHQAQQAHAFIRRWLMLRFGETEAESIRLQYGGSVTATNAPELLSQPDVDGALVGGSSLKPGEFAGIIEVQERLVPSSRSRAS